MISANSNYDTGDFLAEPIPKQLPQGHPLRILAFVTSSKRGPSALQWELLSEAPLGPYRPALVELRKDVRKLFEDGFKWRSPEIEERTARAVEELAAVAPDAEFAPGPTPLQAFVAKRLQAGPRRQRRWDEKRLERMIRSEENTARNRARYAPKP
ncbi:hypothetical protein [Antrihabitans stalactiti]|uniref:Uncharacterized protein n=1 Tax=Antrihabitans stalactiti TaxID=2584121 RepID=A0A848KF48_9NOCA|nr:hypothetical protein [Antrihabitans stalactiti]NMN94810.1 hypothetical protein [Antrihabitans stalactiti]